MAEEITYIPYGLDEISQLDLMTNLANGVPDYLNNKYWARKDKYRNAWMKAYQDIIGRGLVGASNDSGVWRINFNGDDLPLDTMSSLDQEMYHDAAYYIQLQMAKMTPRKKEEEKKQEDLKDYKFYDSFRNHMLQNYYRGNEDLMLDPDEGWHSLDARDPKTGLRDNKNRKAQLVKVLESYKNELEANKDKYKYDNSGFADYNDVVTNIDKAIAALNSPETDDDNPALNALGLRSSTFFSNGGSDIYGTNKETGKSITYQEYYDALNELLKEQAKVDAEKLKLLKANQYNTFRFYGTGLVGKPLSAEHNSMEYLNLLAQKDTLNGDEQSELVGAFKLAARNNALQNLTREELLKFGSAYINHPSRLKKINGLNGLYWDTIGNRVIKPYSKGVLPLINFQDILNQNNPELLEQKRIELQNSKKLKDEDWDIIGADTVSMLGDIISLGGGYAGAAGGITTILSDLYSDIKRGKDFWDVTKNLAKNTAWGLAGLIPGAKLAKLGKRAAQLYALYNSYGIITDPDVHKSWKKLINGEDFTSHDFENLKWTLHAVTGAHNTVRSHLTDKALNNKLNNNKVIVETKNGKRTITTEQQKEINKAGGRGGLEAANKKFLEYAKAEAKEGSFEFGTNGRKWYNPARYSSKLRSAVSNELKLEGTPTGASKMTIGRMLVEDRNKPIIANPFSSSTYKGWFTNGGPNRGYATMVLGKTYLNTKQNSTTESSTQQQESKPEKITKENIRTIKENEEFKQYKDLLDYKKKDSSRGVLKDGSEHTIEFDGKSYNFKYDGKNHSIIINGNKIKVKPELGMEGLRKEVANFIRQLRKTTVNSKKLSKEQQKELVTKLKELKKKGFLKQGGQINSSLDTIIEDFFKNNNI